EQLGVPLRGCTPKVQYCGDFYGQNDKGQAFPQGISLARILRLLNDLPPGVTELGCHPGFGSGATGAYGEERTREVQVLCDPRVRAALCRRGIEIISFKELLR